MDEALAPSVRENVADRRRRLGLELAHRRAGGRDAWDALSASQQRVQLADALFDLQACPEDPDSVEYP
ncbi:hypothetical protein AAG589_21165 [Isoptericola sp. F-RaC21]|uniref:hypothetical protein n=1 Tax=Isoptericola sp. F-RaC21 TaxID=3141452 RepID=UPI00315BF55A